MDDFDIYGDLEDVDYKSENDKLLLQITELQQKLTDLQAQYQHLNANANNWKTVETNLKKNFSSLLLTAQNEIERKDRLLQELKKGETRTFRNPNQYQMFKKDTKSTQTEDFPDKSRHVKPVDQHRSSGHLKRSRSPSDRRRDEESNKKMRTHGNDEKKSNDKHAKKEEPRRRDDHNSRRRSRERNGSSGRREEKVQHPQRHHSSIKSVQEENKRTCDKNEKKTHSSIKRDKIIEETKPLPTSKPDEMVKDLAINKLVKVEEKEKTIKSSVLEPEVTKLEVEQNLIVVIATKDCPKNAIEKIKNDQNIAVNCTVPPETIEPALTPDIVAAKRLTPAKSYVIQTLNANEFECYVRPKCKQVPKEEQNKPRKDENDLRESEGFTKNKQMQQSAARNFSPMKFRQDEFLKHDQNKVLPQNKPEEPTITSQIKSKEDLQITTNEVLVKDEVSKAADNVIELTAEQPVSEPFKEILDNSEEDDKHKVESIEKIVKINEVTSTPDKQMKEVKNVSKSKEDVTTEHLANTLAKSPAKTYTIAVVNENEIECYVSLNRKRRKKKAK